VFLLLLLGYTLFTGKNNKTNNLVWMLAIQDLANVGTWAWGTMGLAFLYEQLNLTSSQHVFAVGGYMSLLVVIFFFFFFYSFLYSFLYDSCVLI